MDDVMILLVVAAIIVVLIYTAHRRTVGKRIV
jgi:hypothetical protein